MAEKAWQWQGLLPMAWEPGIQLVHILLTSHTGPCPNNTLPPASPTSASPNSITAGEEVFRHMSLWETVHIQVLIEFC